VAGQGGDLEAEIARLRERVQELVQRRDYLRTVAGRARALVPILLDLRLAFEYSWLAGAAWRRASGG